MDQNIQQSSDIHFSQTDIQVYCNSSQNILEEEMATHSSILAWKIPWTEESGGLQSMGSSKSWTQLSDLAHNQNINKIVIDMDKIILQFIQNGIGTRIDKYDK